MAYKFFDKQFLVMPDDEGVINKKVFYSDSLCRLIEKVEDGDLGSMGIIDTTYSKNTSYPFCINSVGLFKLVYYDPHYECRVAYRQGKQIQFLANTGKWEDVVGAPFWSGSTEYRVKPEETWYVHQDIDGHYFKSGSDKIAVEFEGTEEECDAWIAEHNSKNRRMTNRELARWLAEGKGERVDVITKYVSLHYVYSEGLDNEKCDEDIRIREWGSNEWHEPLVEVKE